MNETEFQLDITSGSGIESISLILQMINNTTLQRHAPILSKNKSQSRKESKSQRCTLHNKGVEGGN